MSTPLPTPEKTDAAVQAVSSSLSSAMSGLGFTVGADQLSAIAQFTIDALCMAAWKAAQAAGQAAADAITTEAQAEAAQRKP